MPPLSTDKPCEGSSGQGPGLPPSGLPDVCKKVQPVDYNPPAGEAHVTCTKHDTFPKAGMRYVQPPVPVSYKPEKRYRPPEYQMECGTIYRLSYPGVDADTMQKSRAERVKNRQDNLQPCSKPFSQDTTFRLSYTGVQGERAIPVRPDARYSMMGKGAMQSVTTHRHDYTPKCSDKVTPFSLSTNIQMSTAKMEENTTMRLSYQPVEGEKVQSYKPTNVYRKSDYKFEQDTINRLSYQPWDPVPKEEYPWKKLPTYQQPIYTMEQNTIYRASYLPNENAERPASFKPDTTYTPSGKKFAQETIYRESYQNAFDSYCPVQRVIRGGNIMPSTQPLSQDTTFRLSYTGVAGERAISYKPAQKAMMGAGPMQSITTQRHDYTPKPLIPTANYKPAQTLISSEYKMEDLTTFRASYLPNEGIPKVQSCKPTTVYHKPNYCLESDTINRLSYQPWVAGPKEVYPWMKKPGYQQPAYCMEDTSIYRGSYIAPGDYVPDNSQDFGKATGGSVEPCVCPGMSSVPARNATDDL
ncbi:UNVERIFIED_CONTAM: hypothetical protein PYX00_007152 [Menopon gallinae]|uniref:Stabilizer of axonemal microtubules 2 n=1 Tax=Menopon gallinae TaxID=328185 RepID=A0AAW2HIF1_9NEOP